MIKKKKFTMNYIVIELQNICNSFVPTLCARYSLMKSVLINRMLTQKKKTFQFGFQLPWRYCLFSHHHRDRDNNKGSYTPWEIAVHMVEFQDSECYMKQLHSLSLFELDYLARDSVRIKADHNFGFVYKLLGRKPHRYNFQITAGFSDC